MQNLLSRERIAFSVGAQLSPMYLPCQSGFCGMVVNVNLVSPASNLADKTVFPTIEIAGTTSKMASRLKSVPVAV